MLQSPCWETVKSAARSEGVAPLVAFAARPHLPTERPWCDQTLTRSWRLHDTALQQLGEIVILLHGAGVLSIALKGPVLARRVYSPPFLRKPSGDLDLAVRLDDMERACRAMETAGYSLITSIREAQLTSYHAVLRHPSRLPVELHFRLSHGVLGIPVEDFFERAISFQIPAGPEVLVLRPADELLHLILHLVDDRFAPLFLSYEVRRIWHAATDEVRQQVIAQAARWHFSGVLTLCSVAIQSIWGEPLLAAEIVPRTWLHRRLNEKLYLAIAETAGRGEDQPLGKRLRGRWLDLQTTDRPVDALRRIGSLIHVACSQIRRRNWASGRLRK